MRTVALLVFLTVLSVFPVFSQRRGYLLEDGWKFMRGDVSDAMLADYDDSGWESVTVPHDWAVCGPFDSSNDLQYVAVIQNGETVPSVKTGRTGGLPYVGTGWYRRELFVDKAGGTVWLEFDGAMSDAEVYVNGKMVCHRPYGYSPFICDISDCLSSSGRNVLAVRLHNDSLSSRWYPGAGLYRNVRIVTAGKTFIPAWGMHVTVPQISGDSAYVRMKISLRGEISPDVRIRTRIISPEGVEVSSCITDAAAETVQDFIVADSELWSPETPSLYTAVSEVICGGIISDRCSLRFGIRTVSVVKGKGFMLNGNVRKFKGVCNHHDLGPLGTAVNESAIRYRLSLLKNMGCDAIRTAHNMPSEVLVKLCDEMGFMLVMEPFDEWDIAKCENGYHRYFDKWFRMDMENMLRKYRNSPSVVMWSIGNEVPTQCSPEGYKVAAALQAICHELDPSRPVTCGMDQVDCVLENGFARLLDVPGLNYRVFRYKEAYDKLPHKVVLGTETASTVSSRGVYKFPVVPGAHMRHTDRQSSSYDVEYCSWSNLPDKDFAAAEDYPWTMGQFVWTGFDYLGEPTPYDTDDWPSHSSLFGIIDLASIPKDRYFLYRSMWNTAEHTLHVLPHWTWPGREGEVTPVFVYTDYPWAELFVNGVSHGLRRRLTAEECDSLKNSDPLHMLRRYRLIWDDVRYEPGRIEVVAYDSLMRAADSVAVCTAGEPYAVELIPSTKSLRADGKDLSYVRVRIVDSEGNLCPHADNAVSFEVSGEGCFRAVANGDPTCLDMFHVPRMKAFSGELTVIVQSSDDAGNVVLRAVSEGLEGCEIILNVWE